MTFHHFCTNFWSQCSKEVICIQILDVIMRQWSWNFQRALFPLNCKLEPRSLRRIRLELFSMLYFLLASGSKQCQMRCEMSRHKVFLGKKFESLVRSDVYHHSMSGIDFRMGRNRNYFSNNLDIRYSRKLGLLKFKMFAYFGNIKNIVWN